MAAHKNTEPDQYCYCKNSCTKDSRPGLKVETFIASIFFELTKSLWIALQQA